ncbi:hypothetical protein LCGC14_0389790 [marine sediment metagenome]|uniref:Uncharacterized protein n=1 Tax=marine sediment metagenome TaxID=412755 RepID=A0A0F9TI37_9ZZZZ
MKYKKCKGVLGKDKKPFRPENAFAVRGIMMKCIPYTPTAVLLAFMDSEVTGIIVIDENNDEHTLTK